MAEWLVRQVSSIKNVVKFEFLTLRRPMLRSFSLLGIFVFFWSSVWLVMEANTSKITTKPQ